MVTNALTLGVLAGTVVVGTVTIAQVGQPNSSQLGLWITCLVSVAGSVTALVVAYRTLIKDFVTKTELDAALAKLTLGFEAGLKESRHDFAEKLNNVKLQLENKMETQTQALMENARILGRIEGALGAQRA